VIRSLPNNEGLLYFCDVASQNTDLPRTDDHLGHGKHILWTHLCAIKPEIRQWLQDEPEFDPIITEALMAEDTRPRFLARSNGAFINIRTINTLPSAQPEEMVSIRVWLSPRLIVTSRREDARAVSHLQQLISQQQGPRTPGQFVAQLIREVELDIHEVIDALEENVSTAEVRVTAEEQDGENVELTPLRRRAARLTHYLVPQVHAIHGLSQHQAEWLTEADRNSLVESHDKLTRHVEDLINLRDRLQFLSEELRHRQASRLNTITYLFSVAATVFLPLTFLTGLFGVNLGGLPWSEAPAAFNIFAAVCAVLIVVQIILFKKLKWF